MITRVLNVTCLLIWALCVRLSLPDVSHVIFHFLSCNRFLSLPRIAFFPPSSTFFPILQRASLPSCAHPTPRDLSVRPRGQAHSQKRKNCAAAAASPSSQALLFRSQREDPGISLSNITSNRDSQTFSLMTSGNKASIRVTPPMV